jgi:hypothetical protein
VQVTADMKHACLGDHGADALSHALAVNRVIKQLSLRDNDMSGQGLFCILRGMLTRMQVVGGMQALMMEESEGPPAVVRTLSPAQLGHVAESSAGAQAPAVHGITHAAAPFMLLPGVQRTAQAAIWRGLLPLDACTQGFQLASAMSLHQNLQYHSLMTHKQNHSNSAAGRRGRQVLLCLVAAVLMRQKARYAALAGSSH